MNQREYMPGLESVTAAETRLSSVDGQQGELIVAGFPIANLAENGSFEEIIYLLWRGALPTSKQLTSFRERLAQQRTIPTETLRLLEAAASREVPSMDALRMAAGTLDLDLDSPREEQSLAIVSRLPTIVATYHRLLHGQVPVEPRPNLALAANYLAMLHDATPTPEQVRAMNTYLITVADHGLNASTFAARIIISTDSDLVSAVLGAIGALKGPKHGGAPGPVLEMLQAIGRPENAEPFLRAKLERGQRLMGFGHRVYKVRDPRADILSRAVAGLHEAGQAANGSSSLYELAQHVEKTAVALLSEYKPGRRLQTNVEFYTALLLHNLGLDADLFTPTFAVGRVPGWIAHCLEQQDSGRLIRPDAAYVGERGRHWIPLAQR